MFDNLKCKEIQHELEKAAQANHSNTDCILICALSYGNSNDLYASDGDYKPNILWLNFTAARCRALAGKPKLFFILVWLTNKSSCFFFDQVFDDNMAPCVFQASEVKYREDVDMTDAGSDEPDSNKSSYVMIPDCADFLIVYGASSSFVQALQAVLQVIPMAIGVPYKILFV